MPGSHQSKSSSKSLSQSTSKSSLSQNLIGVPNWFSPADSSTSKSTPSSSLKSSEWTASQAQQAQEITSHVNIEDIAADIVLVLLATQHSLKPIKKSTLLKHFKKLSGKLYNDVMNDVKAKLQDIFGLRLVEIEDKTLSYILVNDIPTDLELTAVPVKPVLDENKMIILLLVLTVIYKNDDEISEAELLMFLKNSRVIGDVEKPVGKGQFSGIEVDKFLKQELTGMLYLTRIEIDRNTDEAIFGYKWGRRAFEEVNRDKLDKFYESIDEVSVEEVVCGL